jgi:hypothetical protein
VFERSKRINNQANLSEEDDEGVYLTYSIGMANTLQGGERRCWQKGKTASLKAHAEDDFGACDGG